MQTNDHLWKKNPFLKLPSGARNVIGALYMCKIFFFFSSITMRKKKKNQTNLLWFMVLMNSAKHQDIHSHRQQHYEVQSLVYSFVESEKKSNNAVCNSVQKKRCSATFKNLAVNEVYFIPLSHNIYQSGRAAREANQPYLFELLPIQCQGWRNTL